MTKLQISIIIATVAAACSIPALTPPIVEQGTWPVQSEIQLFRKPYTYTVESGELGDRVIESDKPLTKELIEGYVTLKKAGYEEPPDPHGPPGRLMYHGDMKKLGQHEFSTERQLTMAELEIYESLVKAGLKERMYSVITPGPTPKPVPETKKPDVQKIAIRYVFLLAASSIAWVFAKPAKT